MLSSTYDLIRTWSSGDFRLELYDTYQTRYGKSQLAYQFFHKEVLVFEGADYGPSPLHSIDGDLSVAGLLSFLSLRPGDTDMEYFRDYTRKQFAFADHYGEELSLEVEVLENQDAECEPDHIINA